MSSLPINDLSSFSPQNDFLTGVIDQAADQTTKEITSETVPTEEKEAQRKEYIRLTSEMACLKGKGIVNTVLGELEGANTNLDFLNAMKRLEPLIARVRRRLTEAQILLPNRDAFAPLEFTQATTRKPVSPLQRLTAEKNTVANNAAVMFLNRILPLLGTKWDELQRGAYRTSEGVFREDHDFATETYGIVQKKSQKTNVDLGIWRGVQFEQNSKGCALLKLCSEYQPGDEIGIEILRDRMYHGEEVSEALDTRLNQTLFNILAKFENGSKPFVRVRGGKSIKITGDSETAHVPETSDFVPNADFLAQPLVFSQSAASSSPVLGDVTVDVVDTLGLSEKAAKVLTYFIEHPDVMTKVSSLSESLNESAQFAVELPSLVQAINDGIAQHTRKRLIKTGNMIIFRIPE